VGFEPEPAIHTTEVTDSIKRQNRQKRQKAIVRLRGGYAGSEHGRNCGYQENHFVDEPQPSVPTGLLLGTEIRLVRFSEIVN
jgi:hypothetical protein